MFAIGDLVIHNGINYQITKVNGYNSIELRLLEDAIICHKELIKTLDDAVKDSDSSNYAIAKWFIETKKLTHGYINAVRRTKIEPNKEIIRKLNEIDGYNHIEIVLVLSKSMKDEFWKDKILTCASLRKKIKGSERTWFDNIRAGLYLDNKKEDGIKKMQSTIKEIDWRNL